MRLTRPTLVTPEVIISESKDLPQNLFAEMVENDATTVKGSEQIAAGQFMLLPQSFGNIYLGETFSSYICVHNCTPHPVEEVRVTVSQQCGTYMYQQYISLHARTRLFFQADLQSDKTKVVLPINEGKPGLVTLNPPDTLDDVIHHEVREIGVHM